MLVASLQRIDNAQDLGGIAPSARRIGEDGANGLLWVDHEDAADCEGNALLVHVGGILVVDPTCTHVNDRLFKQNIAQRQPTCRT